MNLRVVQLVSLLAAGRLFAIGDPVWTAEQLFHGEPLPREFDADRMARFVAASGERREGRAVWQALGYPEPPVKTAAVRAARELSRDEQLFLLQAVLGDDPTWDAIRFGTGWDEAQRDAFERACLALIRHASDNPLVWIDFSWEAERDAVRERLVAPDLRRSSALRLSWETPLVRAVTLLPVRWGAIPEPPVPGLDLMGAASMSRRFIRLEALLERVRVPGAENRADWPAVLEEARDRAAVEVLIAAFEGLARGSRRLPSLLATVSEMTRTSRRVFARAALETDALWVDRRFEAGSEGGFSETLRGNRAFADLLSDLLGESPSPLDTPDERQAVARRLRKS